MSDLTGLLAKVRALINQAEHPNTAPVEAEAFRAKADEMMTKYAIEDAMLADAMPAELRSRPGKTEVALAGIDLTGWVTAMANMVARHCRCMLRVYTRYSSAEQTWYATAYGFESDLRYFEILYTTLRLHMIGALRPSIDPEKSLDDNVYALHNAGLNWLEIAELYGWRKSYRQEGETQDIMYEHRTTHERRSNWQLGSLHKRAYYRAIKARGEAPVKFAAGAGQTFRNSAAQGYTTRIRQRLLDLESKRTGNGAALVLANRAGDLKDFFRQENPDLFQQSERSECEACKKAKSGHCRRHPRGRYSPLPFNSEAYQSGMRHANTASLNPEAGAARREALS